MSDVFSDLNIEAEMEEYRIAVYPEYEGQWLADLFYDQEAPIVTGIGESPRMAVYGALFQYSLYKQDKE